MAAKRPRSRSVPATIEDVGNDRKTTNMAKTQIAFLDLFHPNIYAAISRALPGDWLAAYAESREFADQAAAVAGAEVIFALAAPIGPELLSAAPRLRLIQKLGAGTDRIDRDGCAQRGIAIARLAGGNAVPAAEHTVLLMLAVLRRLPLIDRKTRAGEWLKEEARGLHRQLHGKQIGLIGFGAIGRAVAGMLAGFNVDIAYFDPAVPPADVERKFGVRHLALAELLATSDIVSLHLPLLPDTAGLISEERIATMKPGPVLINCARGGLVDEAAPARGRGDGARGTCRTAEPGGCCGVSSPPTPLRRHRGSHSCGWVSASVTWPWPSRWRTSPSAPSTARREADHRSHATSCSRFCSSSIARVSPRQATRARPFTP